MSDGDRGGLLELIQLYLSKTLEQMGELDKSIRAGASADVARIAHSMVGANAMVGMDEMVPLLRTLESDGEKKDMGQARTDFEVIRNRFNDIHVQLQKTLDSLTRP